MHQFYDVLILAVHKTVEAPGVAGEKGLSLSWGLVLIGVILGVAITLVPSKRTTEIKRSKED